MALLACPTLLNRLAAERSRGPVCALVCVFVVLVVVVVLSVNST